MGTEVVVVMVGGIGWDRVMCLFNCEDFLYMR